MTGAVRPANARRQMRGGEVAARAAPARAPRTAGNASSASVAHQIERAEAARIVQRQPPPAPRSRSADDRACRSRPDRSASGPTCRGGRSSYRRDRCRSARIWRGATAPVTVAPVIRWRRSTGIARRRSARRGSTLRQPLPLQHRAQAAHGRLDFGKLGHGNQLGSVCRRRQGPARAAGMSDTVSFGYADVARDREDRQGRRGLPQRRRADTI